MHGPPRSIPAVCAFPFIFRGALDCRAVAVNEEMKLAATYAIAKLARQPKLKRPESHMDLSHLAVMNRVNSGSGGMMMGSPMSSGGNPRHQRGSDHGSCRFGSSELMNFKLQVRERETDRQTEIETETEPDAPP